MKRFAVLTLTCLLILCLAACNFGGKKPVVHTVTKEEWVAALSDDDHRQALYSNVTITVQMTGTDNSMTVSVADGAIVLSSQGTDDKTMCIPMEGTYYTFVWNNAEQKWYRYAGKAEGMDEYMTVHLPEYVDVAMEGLQEKYSVAVYNETDKSYTVTAESDQLRMDCELFFKNGNLIALDTTVDRGGASSSIRLSHIGTTKIQAPTDFVDVN